MLEKRFFALLDLGLTQRNSVFIDFRILHSNSQFTLQGRLKGSRGPFWWQAITIRIKLNGIADHINQFLVFIEHNVTCFEIFSINPASYMQTPLKVLRHPLHEVDKDFLLFLVNICGL